MAAIIAQLAAANRKRKQKAKHTLPPEKSNLALPPFDPCFDPQKHNRYLRLKKLVEHRRSVLTKAKEIAQELQKDDEEWCYFMRYGKPRRNHQEPEAIKDPDRHAQIHRRAQIWKFVTATFSCIGIWAFVIILIILFLIFHQIDGKSWYCIFGFCSSSSESSLTNNSDYSTNTTVPFH